MTIIEAKLIKELEKFPEGFKEIFNDPKNPNILETTNFISLDDENIIALPFDLARGYHYRLKGPFFKLLYSFPQGIRIDEVIDNYLIIYTDLVTSKKYMYNAKTTSRTLVPFDDISVDCNLLEIKNVYKDKGCLIGLIDASYTKYEPIEGEDPNSYHRLLCLIDTEGNIIYQIYDFDSGVIHQLNGMTREEIEKYILEIKAQAEMDARDNFERLSNERRKRDYNRRTFILAMNGKPFIPVSPTPKKRTRTSCRKTHEEKEAKRKSIKTKNK